MGLQCRFIATDLDEDAFTVLRFKGRNVGLSKHYGYEIELLSQVDIDSKALLNKKARVITDGTNSNDYMHGIITRLRDLGPTLDGQRQYHITLSSPLDGLTRRVTPRVLVNRSAIEIAREILETAGWSRHDFEIKSSREYPRLPMCMQRDETDLAFLERLLAQHGLFYCFKQEKSKAVLLITDDVRSVSDQQPKTIAYHSQSGTVRPDVSIDRFLECSRTLTEDIKLKNYHYESPDTCLAAYDKNHSGIPGLGTHYIYGDDFTTPHEGAHLAKSRQEAIDWQRQTVSGTTDCTDLQVGQTFTLADHPIEHLNADYRIIAMEQEAKPGSYRTSFTAIKASLPYRTPPKPMPTFHHTLPAQIDSPGGEYAYLDDQGRYRVLFPFDQQPKSPGQASPPLRLLQPYGGLRKDNQPTGMHCPLHAKTQVAVGFHQGNLDDPTLMGVITDPSQPSPVNTHNKSQNVLRTWGGNELTTEEKKGKESILLATRNHKNALKLDATKDKHRVTLTSEEGSITAFAKRSIKLHTDATYRTTADRNHITLIENNQHLLTRKGNIELQAGRNLYMKAEGRLQTKTDSGTTHIHSAQSFKSETQANLSLQSTNGDLQFKAARTVHLQTAKGLTLQGQGNADIQLGQPGRGIIITPAGDLTLRGPTITLNAPQINIYGA